MQFALDNKQDEERMERDLFESAYREISQTDKALGKRVHIFTKLSGLVATVWIWMFAFPLQRKPVQRRAVKKAELYS